jgi:hypothetical protein
VERDDGYIGISAGPVAYFAPFEEWPEQQQKVMQLANGRILVESRNIYDTDNPVHLAFHERNRQRGRMAGQIRIRVRYQTIIGPWFDYLMVSPEEMAEIVAGTG